MGIKPFLKLAENIVLNVGGKDTCQLYAKLAIGIYLL